MHNLILLRCVVSEKFYAVISRILVSSLSFCVDSSIILPFLPLQIPGRSLAE